MTGAQYLIVNADDFGLSRDVNEGILYAYHHGIVRSASLLMTADACDHAVALSRTAPGLDIGVHLGAFGVRPILPARRLHGLVGSDGRFAPTPWLAMQRLMRNGSPARLEAEFRAQLDVAQRSGLQITHVDCHGHLQVWPRVFRVIKRLAREYRIPWVRLPCEASIWTQAGIGWVRRLPVAGANALCRWMQRSKRMPDDAAWSHPRLLGIGVSGRLTEAWLLRRIHEMPGGVTELVCHPGFVRSTSDGYRRSQEVSALTSPAVQRAIVDCGIVLTNFRELTGARTPAFNGVADVA